MKINEVEKQRLITTTQEVYFGYLALDFFKTRTLCIGPEKRKISLVAYCEDILRSEMITALVVYDVLIASKYYQLYIQPSSYKNSVFEVCCKRIINQPSLAFRSPNNYSDDEALQLCMNRSFFVERLENEASAVSLELSNHHRLGGIGKYDLYRTHLVTLFKIVTKLSNEKDISHLLVALTTGSGKTFVQALWLEILYLAGFNGIFAMPDKLIDQFIKQIRRLLSDKIIDKILQLRDNEKDSSRAVFDALINLNTPGKLIVASSECLLERHYDVLLTAPENSTFLSFDEHHLLIEKEREWGRLLQVSSRLLSMYLTATPDLDTYELSGCNPVAIMSSGQKQKEGQGQFPTLKIHYCQFMSDYNKAYMTENYWDGLFNAMLLKYSNVIQPERSSAARSVLEELPYFLDSIPDEPELRWRLQVPVARKILLIVDDNESLVNCFDFLQNPPNASDVMTQPPLRVYHGGNILKRDGVTAFFGLKNVDRDVLAWTYQQRNTAYFQKLSQAEVEVLSPMQEELSRFGLAAQLKQNMFHYLVEYVLSDVTSMTLIQHNQLRKHSAKAFQQLIIANFVYRDRDYYETALKMEIDAQGAIQISVLLNYISTYLYKAIVNKDVEILALIADNWFLDSTLYKRLWNDSNYAYHLALNTFENEYLVMGLMTGMTQAEMPIKESKPFMGLDEDAYGLYDAQGILVERAKKRRRTPIELLNDKVLEYSFKPKYKDVSEAVADAYFRLGFVGMYISNKKTEGFNDLNLHTVINVAEQTLSVNNSPISLIQGVGRNRGMDNTVKPIYIHALGRRQSSGFNLNLLEKDDYYPELFAAQARYNQHYIAKLGEQVGKDIVAWYYEHQNADESIDKDQLKRQVLRLVARALRRLNIQSNHRIELSRAQLAHVIDKAMEALDDEIRHIQEPYRLSLFVRTVGSMMSFIADCYHWIMNLKTTWERYNQAGNFSTNSRSTEEQADNLYQKILNQTSYQTLMSRTLVAAEFRVWMKRKAVAIPYIIKQSTYDYLKPEVQLKIKEHFRQALFPLLIQMVVDDKKALVLEKLLGFEDSFSALLQRNESVIRFLLDEPQSVNMSQPILALLQQVPGLTHLNSADCLDISDYVTTHTQWMQQLLALLLSLSPTLQDKVIIEIRQFLQNDFSNYLGAFVSYVDKLKITQTLQNTDRVESFLRTVMHENLDVGERWDAPTIFASFKQTFELQDCDLLSTRMEQMQRAVEGFKQPIIEKQLDEVVKLIQQELLPCLVCFYPLNARQALLQQIDTKTLRAWLVQEQQSIIPVMREATPAKIAAYLFDKLCKSPLPAQIDPIREADRLKSNLDSQLGRLGSLTNGVSYLLNQVPPVLKSEEFWALISLLLPYHHYLEFKTLFENESKQALEFSHQLMLVALQQKQKGDKLTPQELIVIINKVFKRDYTDTQSYAEQVKNQLEALTDPVRTNLSGQQKQAFAIICRKHILPLLAMFIQDDESKALFLNRNYTDAELTHVFMLHSTTLEKLVAPSIPNKQALVSPVIEALCPNFVTEHKLVDPIFYAQMQHRQCQQTLQNYLRPVFTEVLTHDTSMLNRDKVIDLLLTQLTPIIKHPQFKELLNVVLHALTLDELTLIFETLEVDRPAEVAERLLRFKTLVNQQNLREIKRIFILETEQDTLDLDHLLLRHVLDDFGKLLEEMMRCHCYYNQMSVKGELDSSIKPRLWSRMSEPLKKIRVPASNSFLSRCARKIFFMQSIRKGLIMAGRVSADSNRDVITLLQRVKTHILRPLRLRMNLSTLFSKFKLACQKIVAYFKKLVEWIAKCWKASKPLEQDIECTEYEEAAVACADSIHALTPLTSEQVKDNACSSDVVSIVEKAIEQRPSKLRLFEQPRAEAADAAPESVRTCFYC